MPRIDRWLSETPRRPAAEIACLLARDRFWKDERRRLLGTHPDWPDAVWLLDLSEELAHAVVLVLSRVPAARRLEFANVFYVGRQGGPTSLPSDARARLALAAAVVLNVVEIAAEPGICDERTLDLLHGAAQGDDLTQTPGPAVDELRETIARIRLEVENDDPADPRQAVAVAVAEVLDPAGEQVDFKEVLARSAWAAVETREAPGAIGFLLEVDRLLSDV
ncbi:MAG: hypothetical protein H0T39_07450 [Actinobacteria bacterium]|nr:hypothetical protein [Actinomycetota bacterium]